MRVDDATWVKADEVAAVELFDVRDDPRVEITMRCGRVVVLPYEGPRIAKAECERIIQMLEELCDG